MDANYNERYKIAIVEDEVPIAQMYKYKFELEGFAVRLAHNGTDGLVLCQEFAPDVVLLDIRMPGMSGDKMLEQMRATEWGALPHVIVMTNISRAEAPSNLQFLHVDRYIVKAHYTPAQVVDVVREVLGMPKPKLSIR